MKIATGVISVSLTLGLTLGAILGPIVPALARGHGGRDHARARHIEQNWRREAPDSRIERERELHHRYDRSWQSYRRGPDDSRYGRYDEDDNRPPGWSHGRKRGWGNRNLPPGLAKKYRRNSGYINRPVPPPPPSLGDLGEILRRF